MIRIKQGVDVMSMLKDIGMSSYTIAKNKTFGSSTITRFRRHGRPSMGELEKLCRLLKCQPGDIIEYIDDDTSPGD